MIWLTGATEQPNKNNEIENKIMKRIFNPLEDFCSINVKIITEQVDNKAK